VLYFEQHFTIRKDSHKIIRCTVRSTSEICTPNRKTQRILYHKRPT